MSLAMTNNDDMSTNIANLNQNPMSNVAKNVESGINNMAHLNTQQFIQQQQQQQLQQQLHQLQQQQQQFQQPINLPLPQQGMVHQENAPQNLPPMLQSMTVDNKNKKKSTLDKLSNNLKEPILIAVVFVVINHPAFLNVIGKYIPQVASGNNSSMISLVIRGLMLGMIIGLINKFLLK